MFSRIDAVEDKVKAYITLTRDSAMDQAKAVDELLAKGESPVPLGGHPRGGEGQHLHQGHPHHLRFQDAVQLCAAL